MTRISVENGQIDVCQRASVSSTANWPDKGARRVCIIVLGMHRSGTSALTRVINLLGAALPTELIGSGLGNEAGHWEPERLAALHDQMLAEAGSSWDDWRAFNLTDLPLSRAKQYRTDISCIIKDEYGDTPLIVLKEPRICRFAPLYIEVLEDMGYEIKFVHIQRNPLDVEASLEKRDGFLPSFSDLLWLRHTLDAEVATRGHNRVFVCYEALMNDWRSVIDKINAELAVNWNREGDAQIEIDSFLTDEHRHYESPVEAVLANDKLSWWLKETFQGLTKLEAEANNADTLARLDHLRSDFDHASLHVGQPVLATLTSRSIAQVNAEREAQVAYFSRLFSERDVQAAALNQTINELTQINAEREAQVANFSREIAQREVQAAALNQTINELAEQHAAARSELDRMARRPWRTLKNYLIYVVMTRLAALIGPVSQRSSQRFAKSAEKRSPWRFARPYAEAQTNRSAIADASPFGPPANSDD